MSRLARLLFALVPAAGFVATLGLAFGTASVPEFRRPWVPSFGIDFALRVDGLSTLMLLLVTGIGTAVFVYAGGYLHGHPQERRLHVLLTAFLGAMVLAVTADDLFVLFLAWEATSILSFLLVGFDHENEKARKSAKEILLLTGLGGLALLAGFIVLANEAGTTSLSTLTARGALAETAATRTALVLIIVGCFTKSAQFPFHFWLPNAMAAPTPVSAYLHSATMVKLGVFVLARFDPVFGGWSLFRLLLEGAGSITAAWAMVLALRERDLKRILAWSTVATLGTLVMLIGSTGDAAPVAVAALLFAHALYKAPLFFVAGNIDHGTGTRILDRLGNLRRQMPFTAAAAALAGLSMAGLPLSFGFVAKDAILEAKRAGDLAIYAQYANVVFSAVAIAVAGVAAIRVFWHHPGVEESCEAHEGGPSLWIPPLALAATGVVIGLAPGTVAPLLERVAAAITPGPGGPPVSFRMDLAAAAGPLALAFGIGLVVFRTWDGLHARLEAVASRIGRFGTGHAYRRLLSGIPALTAAVTRRVQHASLSRHAIVLAGLAAAALLATAGIAIGAELDFVRGDIPLGAAFATFLVVLGAGAACVLSDRVVLLLASGFVGYGSALLFLFLGAPDLAFTQFAAETVFVVVAAAVVARLGRQGRGRSVPEPRWRFGSLAVAILFGAGITGVALVASGSPSDPTLGEFFGARSLSEASGRNVVNVVLVDFRALDTLGESLVILLSFVAALPLLRALFPSRKPRSSAP